MDSTGGSTGISDVLTPFTSTAATLEKDRPTDESSDAISVLSSASSSDRKSHHSGTSTTTAAASIIITTTAAADNSTVDFNLLNGSACTVAATAEKTTAAEETEAVAALPSLDLTAAAATLLTATVSSSAPASLLFVVGGGSSSTTAAVGVDTESIGNRIGSTPPPAAPPPPAAAARESVVSFEERKIGESSSDLIDSRGDLTLPWGWKRDRSVSAESLAGGTGVSDTKMIVGEYVLQSLFLDFAQKAERKVDAVLAEPLARPLSKSFQRGEDPQFDQLTSCFHAVAEHCLPSLLRTLFAWYERQNVDYSHLNPPTASESGGKQKADASKSGSGSTKSTQEFLEKEHLTNKRNLAVDYLFALVLIEILKQLPFHPGHEHLVAQVENMAFKHFKYRDPVLVGPNSVNFHIVSDLFAEVSGVLAQSRFQSVRKKFMAELKELRFKEITPGVVNNIIALLMGMKFFRVKMVPIEEFEASFQFMQECATYFLEVKDKDIKHAMAGLLVEILMPVAACVKNEVNVPVVKNFVEMLYPTTLDMCAKKKHVLAVFPLVTCLLCVAHKQFFLHNWHHFLTLCLSNLKNRDTKMSRVAVESLYRLLWVYMIRIKCESNSVTQSRLQSIVNSLFPKGSKVVVPRDTPLNIFVKIIQFIAQERMDFAMKEIVFDLLSVGRPIRLLMPERMSIGLRAFLVIADGLQQKEGEPPMPRSLGVLPSGNTIRIKKTYVCKVLTDEEAKAIGVSSYYPLIRKTFEEILRLLDAQVGRSLMLTTSLNQSKEPDEHLIGERKPKVDFLKTCVAAIPRLLPDAMSITDLIALLSRLTVHMDEDLRGLAYQSIQSIIVDFKEHRETAVHVFLQFVVSDISDAYPALVDTALRILIQFVAAWRNALNAGSQTTRNRTFRNSADESRFGSAVTLPMVLSEVESLGFVMLCQSRFTPRRLGLYLLKEAKSLRDAVFGENPLVMMKPYDRNLLDILDSHCKSVIEENCAGLLPPSEKVALSPSTVLDLHWAVERSCGVWNAGFTDSNAPLMVQDAAAAIRSFSSPPNNCEIWTAFISGMMSRKSFLGKCPLAVLAYAWPMVYTRIQAIHTLIDPGPANENRVSLLKTVRQVLSERDLYNNLWQNYLIAACSMLPPHSVFSGNFRCISPDIALSTSSSESNCSEKSDARSASTHVPAVTAHGFYKMAVRLMRSEATDLPDSIVIGLGKTNPEALKDLVDELGPLIKEAVDRKQENVRRKKRKDALRLELAKLFHLLVEADSIVTSSLYTVTESAILFVPSFVEYVDGTRLYLETETDKENAAVLASIQLYFCKFLTGLIHSFPAEQREYLLSVFQRQQNFNLLATWTGKYGQVFKDSGKHACFTASPELEFEALRAMSSLLCCGKVFDRNLLLEDSTLFRWLDLLLATKDERISVIAQETVTVLLCMNSDTPYLLDWVVDRCFTATDDVSDRCFYAIASVFCSRDYPCDQYSAIINLALMNTGCPRVNVQEVALELLQLLDKRFFGQAPIYGSPEKSGLQRSTLNDVLLSGGNYTRNQLYLSEQLAKLHPDLTMPIFSEITCRFQTARPAVQHNLLTYIVPWLYNLELVDFSTTQGSGSDDGSGQEGPLSAKGQGWGSPEGTEMVLNNLMYISAVFGDDLPKEIEQAWSSVCCAWPNNLNIVLKYLIIVSSLSSANVLPVAKRIVRYMARARPERLVNHLAEDLQAVDNLCATVEKIHTPPFFRITSVKRLPVTGIVSDKKSSDEFTSGTIHTKRHTHPESMAGSEAGTRRSSSNATAEVPFSTKSGSLDFVEDVGNGAQLQQQPVQSSQSQQHPLPMPEYGGYFAPMGDLLMEASASITTMHKCSFAISFLGDLLLDGINVAWTMHLPIMLHIAVLGMDSQRPHVYQHCRKLLENLLVVFACHSDHCSVARLLLEKKSTISAKPSLTLDNNSCRTSMETLCRSDSMEEMQSGEGSPNASTVTVHTSGVVMNNNSDMERMVMDLINFLASHTTGPLWSFEDITARVWSCRSACELTRFVDCVNKVFNASVPLTRITQKWAEVAFQYGLNSSSRHYAGRSLQIFRALEMPVTFQVLSDILSRLVETVAESGDDLQGYVTELVLTLEACTDTLTPLDDGVFGEDGHGVLPEKVSPKHDRGKGHGRTISCHLPGGIDFDYRQRSVSDSTISPIHRTYSTQTLMSSPGLDSGGAQTLDDKLSLLSLLFWISMSILESDYEHEFLLALRLMDKVMAKFPLEKPECQERIEKVRSLAKWASFPGVQALVLKGCTSSVTFEPTLHVLSKFIGCFGNQIIDPNRIGFPLNVLAFLPYHLLHFDDPTPLCLDSTRQIATAAREISPGLESLATVMTLYTKRAFAKDAHQWGKCVVKYLFDVYRDLTNILMTFLIEILDKGPATIQQHTLNVIYYFLHYVDINSVTSSVTAELLRVVTRLLEGPNWRECQSIIKLSVIRSSSLMPADNNTGAQSSSISFESLGLMSATPFAERGADTDIVIKKELPGRTLDFTFDVSLTPIAGHRAMARGQTGDGDGGFWDVFGDGSRKGNGEAISYGWKKPSLSQSRTRERLVGLLAVCGQQVGVPKSPSIVFNEFGDVEEPCVSNNSDDAASTVVGGEDHRKGSVAGENSLRDDRSTSENTFTVFKDFDFLEYELDSGENESIDNFNWGVRRTLSNVQDTATPMREKVRPTKRDEPRGSLEEVFSPKKDAESSDDELGSVEIVDMLQEESSVDPVDGEALSQSPAGEGSRLSLRSLESPSDQDETQTANL